MKKIFLFIFKKCSNIKLIDIFLLEYHSLIQFISNFLPGNFGLLIRGCIYKIFLFSSCRFSFIQKDVCFVHCHKIKFGKNFTVNSFCYINAIGGLSIGDNVLIGPSVIISSGKHNILPIGKPIIGEPTSPLPITIGDDVWLGANVTILPGVVIADGTVVGANSVLTKSSKKNGVYAGVPAKLIRSR